MLDIKYYVLIDAIARHGSLQAAASAIGLTQPAATHRIREMERRLAVSLFEKRGRRIYLTPAGLRLLETARQVIPSLQQAEHDATMLARDNAPRLKWGVDAHDTITDILSARHQHQMAALHLYRFSSTALSTALLEHQIDIALMTDPPVQKGINSLFLFEDELQAVVPSTHPLARQKSVSAQALAQQRYLTFSAAREPGHEFDLFFHPSGQTPDDITIIESVKTLLDLIAESQEGVTILSRWAIRASRNTDKLTVLPLENTHISIPWHLACLDNDIVNENLPSLKTIFESIHNR